MTSHLAILLPQKFLSIASLVHAPATLPCSENSKALMSFFELYSANVPLLMPSAEWMYRLLYMRGQLSVGERCLALASKILGPLS